MRTGGIVAAAAVAALLAGCADRATSPAAVDDADMPDILLSSANGNNGAWVAQGEPDCALIDGVGNLVYVDCMTEVATFSWNGNAKVTVRASGVYNPTGQVVRWGPENPGWEFASLLDFYFGIDAAPYPCLVDGPDHSVTLFTVNWHAQVTPSGEALFVCHYSEKWEYQWP